MPIEIGPGATDRATIDIYGYTFVQATNPANATGYINSMEFWFFDSATGIKCGTFYGSSTSYTNRDYETIGSVTSGSKQTFTGLNCDVTSGDYLGIYFATGFIEKDTSGGTQYYKSGSQFGAGTQTYISETVVESIYATGIPIYECSGSDGLNVGDSDSAQKILYNILTDGLKVGDSDTIIKVFDDLLSDGIKLSDLTLAQINAFNSKLSLQRV